MQFTINQISRISQNQGINPNSVPKLTTKQQLYYQQINRIPAAYTPSFAGISKQRIAKAALSKFTEHINANTRLTIGDEKWLKPLRKVFGSETLTVNNPNNPQELLTINSRLTSEKINTENGIEALANAIKTMLAATNYKPNKVKLGSVTYSVHNENISQLMKEKYNPEEFQKLKNYLKSSRIFDMTDNPNYGVVIDKERGIAKICGATENWEMSDRAWITDTMRIGDIQKRERPETWTTAMNTISEYYDTQASKFETLIQNPALYREGNAMQGIPHIFMPKTLEPDENWFNNKRLESHGLTLKELANSITDGLVKGKKHGYSSADAIPQHVLISMDNLSKYFKAIDYPTAPSAGNWEEIPLRGGLTSDTEAIRSALVAFKNMMYNPQYSKNAEIQKVRIRMQELNPIENNSLRQLIKGGETRVRNSYLQEAPGVRNHDSSLAFITTSDVRLAPNVIDDVKKHVEILESLEKNLVRENGIIRYTPFKFVLKDGTIANSPDSYLSLNYFNAIDKKGKLNLDWKKVLDQYGSKDCSEPEMFAARAKLSTPNKEAQWFMVSEMSAGYGKQIQKLITNAKKEKRSLDKEETGLIQKLKQKQTEYFNRTLARISDENPDDINQIKANGVKMPSVTLPEAYQYVSDINGKSTMLPGTNAPLAWALSSAYKAMNLEGQTSRALSKLGLA